MRVLLRRRHDGIGDWLFMLACIKHYNEQQSGVQFYVDFEIAERNRAGAKLPPIIREAFECSDVTWYWPEQARDRGFDVVIPHVVYKQDERPYVESMLAQLVIATGKDVEYRPELVPRFVYPELEDRPATYVAIAPRGKKETAFKDWPIRCFDELSNALIERNVDVVQLGAFENPRLTRAARQYLGCSFDTVAGAIAGARMFIGIENGIAVLASWLGTPTVVLYQSGSTNHDRGALGRSKRWSGPAIARMVRPGVADVVALATKELKC